MAGRGPLTLSSRDWLLPVRGWIEQTTLRCYPPHSFESRQRTFSPQPVEASLKEGHIGEDVSSIPLVSQYEQITPQTQESTQFVVVQKAQRVPLDTPVSTDLKVFFEPHLVLSSNSPGSKSFQIPL